MVLVAVALLALIGSAALVLLAGSNEWQKNQLQEDFYAESTTPTRISAATATSDVWRLPTDGGRIAR